MSSIHSATNSWLVLRHQSRPSRHELIHSSKEAQEEDGAVKPRCEPAVWAGEEGWPSTFASIELRESR